MELETKISRVLANYGKELVQEWVQEQLKDMSTHGHLMSDQQLRSQCEEFVHLVQRAAALSDCRDMKGAEWEPTRDMLASISKSRAHQGYTAAETALFVLSFKKPFFDRLRLEHGGNTDALAADLFLASDLLENLALHTTNVFQASREEIIRRQELEIMELSTPVIQLWPGILCIPFIGTFDSERTHVMVESLLQKIADTRSEIAILDISGVATVDTLVAQHIMKTIAAVRLMGADCFISGLRPAVAQTMVQLGVELLNVITKANLGSAMDLALRRLGLEVRNVKQ